MVLRPLCCLGLLAFGLVACAAPQKQVDWNAYLAKHGDALPEYSAEKVDALYRDKTVRFFDKSHGNQIEYMGPDGRAYLWYPGNTRTVDGYWQVKGGKLICHQYEAGLLNPVTGDLSGPWNCTPIARHLDHSVERCDGDMFRLQTGVPRVLARFEKISLGCAHVGGKT